MTSPPNAQGRKDPAVPRSRVDRWPHRRRLAIADAPRPRRPRSGARDRWEGAPRRRGRRTRTPASEKKGRRVAQAPRHRGVGSFMRDATRRGKRSAEPVRETRRWGRATGPAARACARWKSKLRRRDPAEYRSWGASTNFQNQIARQQGESAKILQLPGDQAVKLTGPSNGQADQLLDRRDRAIVIYALRGRRGAHPKEVRGPAGLDG